jgi:molybdopterin converting factor small subunit
MFRVLLFAVLRDAAGSQVLELDDSREEISVPELLGLCAQNCPAIAKYLPHVRVAVDLEYVTNEARVRQNQEIALLPPVAGGA